MTHTHTPTQSEQAVLTTYPPRRWGRKFLFASIFLLFYKAKFTKAHINKLRIWFILTTYSICYKAINIYTHTYLHWHNHDDKSVTLATNRKWKWIILKVRDSLLYPKFIYFGHTWSIRAHSLRGGPQEYNVVRYKYLVAHNICWSYHRSNPHNCLSCCADIRERRARL